MSNPETKPVTFNEKARKSDTHGTQRVHNGHQDDDHHENAAKYRKKIDELNRSRDFDIERVLTLRGG